MVALGEHARLARRSERSKSATFLVDLLDWVDNVGVGAEAGTLASAAHFFLDEM